MSENSYLRHFSAQVSQIVFLAYLTILRLITTVWPEMSENSLSPPFQCTSITNRDLRLFDPFTAFTTVWPEISENSYLHHFSAQVSQIVFFVYLTVLRLKLQLYDLKYQKTHISATSVHKYQMSCSYFLWSFIWPYYG